MTSGAPDEDTNRPRQGRGRTFAIAVLLVLGSILAPLSLVAVWARNTVLDTDGYVSTVAPLARNRAVIDAAATRITARVMTSTDIRQRLAEALPPRAARAAPAMTRAIRNVVYDAAVKALSSDQFAQIWEGINRRVQPQVVAALTGKSARGIEVEDGAVILDLTPVANRVRAKITSLGFDVNEKVPGRLVNPELVLFRSPYVGWTQDGVDLLQRLAWVLPVLMLACFGAGIGLSRHRSRTVVHAGLGLAAGVAVLLTGLALGRPPYLGLFPRPSGREAAGAAYDQVLHQLRIQGRAAFALGLVIAFGGWLAGPGAGATRLRARVTGRERAGEPGPLATWVGHARGGLRVVVVGLGAVVLVALDHPSGLTVLVVAAAVLAGLLVIELVGRSGKASTAAPGAQP